MTKIAEGVWWVGHVDWPIRDFHGYRTEHGSTYNAYLVRGERTALVDAVKAPYAGDLLAKIAEIVPPESVDYVVVNHAEPDHASGLPAALAAMPRATVVCNAKCRDALARHFDVAGWRFRIVSEGETLDLGGGRTLRFLMTPMVHWPESMATYLPEEALLFSMDAFGQHLASSERFDDQLPLPRLLDEAKTYYANIVQLYGRPVQAALARLGALPLRTVCPSHGVVWRAHVADILAAYAGWAVHRPVRKVVVLFCTMWGSTRRMAEEIAKGAEGAGDVDVKLIDISATHDTETVTELLDCAALAVGSPTLNIGMMPAAARTLCYAKGLRPAGKKGFAFGSYGWAEKGASAVDAELAAWGVERIRPPLVSRFRPDPATLAECLEAGRRLGEIAAAAEA